MAGIGLSLAARLPGADYDTDAPWMTLAMSITLVIYFFFKLQLTDSYVGPSNEQTRTPASGLAIRASPGALGTRQRAFTRAGAP